MKCTSVLQWVVIFFSLIALFGFTIASAQIDFREPDENKLYQELNSLSREDLQNLCQSVQTDLETMYLAGQYPDMLLKSRLLAVAGSIIGDEFYQADAAYLNARALSRQGKENEALCSLYQAFPIYEQRKDIRRQIRALEVMIRVAQNLDLWDDAQLYAEKLKSLTEMSGDRFGQMVTLLNRGVIAFHNKNIDEAEKSWQQVIQDDPEGIYPEITGLALNHLSRVYLLQGKVSLARDFLQKALTFAQEKHLPWVEFVVRLSFSELLTDYSFEYDQAIDSLNRCLQLVELMGLSYQRLWVQNNLSVIYTELGDFGKARSLLESALNYQNQAGIQQDTGVLLNLGTLNWHLGQYETAEKYLTRAYELAQTKQDDPTSAKALANLGTVAKAQGKYEAALANYEKALTLFETLGLEIEIANLMNNIANLNFQFGELDRAEESLRMALKTYIKYSLTSGIAQVRINLGYVALAKKNRLRAKTLFSHALLEAKRIQNQPLVFYAQLGLAEVHLENLNGAMAIPILYDAVKVLEETRGKMENVNDQICFTENRLAAYDLLIEELIRQQRYPEAIDVSERVKARSFLDIVAGHSIHVKPTDWEVYQQIQRLQGEKESLQEKKSQLLNINPENQDQLLLWQINQQLNDIETKLNTLLKDYNTVSPELLSLVAVNPTPLAAIQPQLDDDTLVVDYYVFNDKTVVWIIEKENVNTVVLPIGESRLQPLLVQLREQLSNPQKTDYITLLDSLSQNLIVPLLDFFRDKQYIVIIPHRSLNYIPFQALIANHHYLVENYLLSYAPSLNAYLYSFKKRGHGHSSLLAFGNPAFNDPSLIPLPGAETEVKEIAHLFHQPEIHIGSEATKTQFYQRSGNFDIIHLSTHAMADENFPLYSMVAFAPDQTNDGYLFAFEVFQLSLNANLVILSACQTALGQLSATEGLVGLSRSFFYAGTPTLIASLWSVNDQSTMELFIQFYSYWTQGYSKSQALQLAQKDILARYPHPYYWAPFILIGCEK